MNRTYRALTGLALLGAAATAAALWPAPWADAAGMFQAEPLAEGSTVALAQPVDGNRWNLVVVERLQAGRGCWQRHSDGLVTLEADALSNEAGCSRLQSSSGYSLRAAGQDLRTPWRLRIEAVGERLELQAFNPGLSTPVTIGTAPIPSGVIGAALPAFSLNPGWSFQRRSYQGRLLSHVYLSSAAALAARRPPVLPALSSPQPGRDPLPGQVISLQVVPFSEDAGFTASTQ